MKRLFVLAMLVACSKKEPVKEEPPKPGIQIVRAEPGEIVAKQVVGERAKAQKYGRTMIVYIGAEWCEPCQRFHKAAQSGVLDKDFPNLTLLEYDLDVDGSRLSKAGYAPGYIPYFGIPGEDGKATTHAVAGAPSGEGAVDTLKENLRSLFAD